jgi:(2Fe-2S) ferredoxin
LNKILNNLIAMGKYEAIRDTKIQTSFALEGRFLGYAADDRGKLKFIRLASSEHPIKLSKDLRSQRLSPGDWIRVTGNSWVNQVTGQIKLKAEELTIASSLSLVPAAISPVAASKPSKPETILVCQKSDCCKLGAKAIATALQTAIQDQGLTHQVVVKGTGCMKRCKAGPNLVMPDKTRYTKISPKAIPALIEQHFDPAAQSSSVKSAPIVAEPVAS